MDSLENLFYHDGKLFGVEWHFWKVVGWTGNAIFFSRFFVQWYATEKLKRVVVPPSFWWLSLAGSLLLLSYGVYRQDSVFIFAYAFTWIPYIRNLVIGRRHGKSLKTCHECGNESSPGAIFCSQCGTKLNANPRVVLN